MIKKTHPQTPSRHPESRKAGKEEKGLCKVPLFVREGFSQRDAFGKGEFFESSLIFFKPLNHSNSGNKLIFTNFKPDTNDFR